MENAVAFEVARVALDKFAGDTMIELEAAWKTYLDLARSLPLTPPDPRTDPSSVRLA